MSSSLKFITRSIFVSGLVLIAAVGTMTVVAIQLFAPADYKPSSILAANNSISSVSVSSALSSISTSSNSSATISTTQINIGSNINSTEVEDKSSALNSGSSKSSTLQTYKNQYFPNFELNYDSDWKVENVTSPSLYPELIKRTISFTKNDLKFHLILSPAVPTGCAGPETQIDSTKTLSGGIYRVKYSYGGKTYTNYTKTKENPECRLQNLLISNIKASNVPKYKELLPSDNNVEYLFDFDTKNTAESSKNNLYDEIDKIINQSKFQ